MTEPYRPGDIEARWQARWQEDALYRRPESPQRPYYALTMYPYPSGNLHMGHWFAYAPSDASARFQRMQGNDVFFPFGFDAFGLPAENAAIQRGIHPREWTLANIARMRVQLRTMGAMFDWSAEVVTSEPEFYRWNQWFFLRFLERGLAYRKWAAVDWCPSCNTTLAREQVVGENRVCERCGTPVVKRELAQWFLGITEYADELLAGLDDLDWPERVKTMQRNWIGRSEGAEIVFPADGQGPAIEVFTTRPDTLFGATAVVLAPEHPAVQEVVTPGQADAVARYRAEAERETEIDRLAADRPKTGVDTGGYVRQPLSGERLPIWVADYVLPTYGHGAVMLVPAHDERDFAFAQTYGLPVSTVVTPPGGDTKTAVGMAPVTTPGASTDGPTQDGPTQDEPTQDGPTQDGPTREARMLEAAYTGPGVLVNSGAFTGLTSFGKLSRAEWSAEEHQASPRSDDVPPGQEAKEAIAAALKEAGLGGPSVTFRLRDWLISRQRYWGTPIPVIHCPECGPVPVPEEDLPVTLPEGVAFLPTGESPLKFADAWRDVTCPECGGPAERDTDTMDTFVDSSWYQYRYLSPHYAAGPFDRAMSDWLPVKRYTGGIEHATMHLLYTRFWTKAMRDLGLVEFDEPMLSLFNQGIILGEDSEKMSKSRGNVVDPDALVAEHGADAVRAYLMFIGPWDQGGLWDPRGIQGPVRFLHDVWELAQSQPGTGAAQFQPGHGAAPSQPGTGAADPQASRMLRRAAHQTLARVTADYEAYAFNTAIAAMMELRNTLKELRGQLADAAVWDEAIDMLLLMLAPVAPHIAEELWARRGNPYSIHLQPWPAYDAAAAAEDHVEIGVQIQGKLRDRVTLPADVGEEQAVAAALASPVVQEALNGAEPRRVIYVPGRLVNIVP